MRRRETLAARSLARWAALLLLASAAAVVVSVRSRPIPADAAYLGSASCRSCHAAEYRAWAASQHTKMMRPADRPGVVVADFDVDDPGLRFEREDAVWAIGGKWEQQFMGHDGTGDTLLPGAWLGLAGHWDFQGWDGWQIPVPRRRCHGCHTVGLDAERGSFVETNIGCESCHGPGSWHVASFGLGAIHSSLDAQVCGQCHTRGRSPSGEYHFPIGYRPGDRLDEHFEAETPTLGQNSSHWWGNGRPRERHEEYTAWRQGGHASSVRSLGEGYDGRYGAVKQTCFRCHVGEAAVGGGSVSPGEAHSVTCSVCHNVHGDLERPRIECQECHTEGGIYHEPERLERHVPCPPEAGVGCVDCHMPRSVRIGGAFALHDHAPGIVPPRDAVRWGTPTSCANGGCHEDDAPDELQHILTDFYGRDG